MWTDRRGSALLAMLWLAAALAAIAFSVSNTVRGETDRASTASEGLKAYHIAAGGVQLGALELLWQHMKPGNTLLDPGPPKVLRFPQGEAVVEYIPEASKLDINGEQPETLFRLLSAMGVDPGRAAEITAAIADWRGFVPGGGYSRFDEFYLSQNPSFRASHSSLIETDELLLVKGVTPDLYYGSWTPAPEAGPGQPRLIPHSGLRDCVSVFGSKTSLDVNAARPEVLLALGVPPDVVNVLLQQRRTAPVTVDSLPLLLQAAGPAGPRLRIGGGTIWTIRATARLRLQDGRLSDISRTVAAMYKYMPPGYDSPMHLLRWYDTAWSN